MLEDEITFKYQDFVELGDFLSYHDDLDVKTLISKGSDVTIDDGDNNDDDDDDPFIVERIIDKRFHG